MKNKRKNLKILFVSNDSLNYGSSKSMINLAYELKKYDLDIKVLIPANGPLEEFLIERKIEYKIQKYFSWINKIGKKTPLIKIKIKKIINYFQAIILSLWVKKEKFDIIHSVNSAVYIGALISKITKVKHVWHIRELMEEDHNLEFNEKEYAIKLLNSADKLICISKSVENKYKNYIDNRKLKLVYNGVPVEEYSNEALQDSPTKFKILIAGSISQTKGQKEAIEAIEILTNKNIKNIELLIAGDGEYEKELKKYVELHNLSKYITFLGFIKNLKEIRNDSNIALICSRNEAFGRVTVESMMSKNLVIGANTGGTLELIQEGQTGFLYEQGNHIDLANKIEYAINNWNECVKIINEAYKYSINNFSIERCAKQVYKIYKEL